MNEPTPSPRHAADVSPKVAAAAVGAAVTIVILWIIEASTGIDIPVLVEGAATTLATFGLGYLIRDDR